MSIELSLPFFRGGVSESGGLLVQYLVLSFRKPRPREDSEVVSHRHMWAREVLVGLYYI